MAGIYLFISIVCFILSFPVSFINPLGGMGFVFAAFLWFIAADNA